MSGETKLSNKQKVQLLWGYVMDALRPPEKLDVDDWADQYYVLPKEATSEHGQWRTVRFPFLRRIMKCLSPSSRAREISAKKGAQLGFTELAKIWIGYTADQDPGPMMYVQKTIEAAEDFAEQKLNPTILACPKLAKTLGPEKPKHLTNQATNQGFPGGFVVIGGSNSGAFLRSKSISKAVADEEDSFKANVDGEGSPISLIKKRQVNFPFRKFFRISTPKIKETSTIEPAYEAGSQEEYYLPCPECNPKAQKEGTWWTLKWKNLKWPKNEKGEAIVDPKTGVPDEVELLCETCGCLIPESKKNWMLENGRWMSIKGLPKEEAVPYEVGDVEKPSFNISSLYSPLGFFSWRDAVEEWFEYRKTGDKAKHQVFINQTLGETYTLAGKEVSSNWLHSRREEYKADVPEGALVVVAGVDVQQDRLEIDIVGVGLNMETYAIEYKVFWGDTAYLGDEEGNDAHGAPTVWTILDEYLLRTWENERGEKMRIECTLIDSKYKTETVHKFCAPREHRRIFPSRGQDGWGKGYIERPKRRSEKYHTWGFKVWVDEVKELVYSLLSVEVSGAGYQHFPEKDEYTEAYFQGLTAESREVKIVNGSKKLQWVCPKGVRNEPLDCRVYALAAFKVYGPDLQYRVEQRQIQDDPTRKVALPRVQKRTRKKKGIKRIGTKSVY